MNGESNSHCILNLDTTGIYYISQALDSKHISAHGYTYYFFLNCCRTHTYIFEYKLNISLICLRSICAGMFRYFYLWCHSNPNMIILQSLLCKIFFHVPSTLKNMIPTQQFRLLTIVTHPDSQCCKVVLFFCI